MTEQKKAVYFLCIESIEHVAGNVFRAASQALPMEETDILVDENRVMKYIDPEGNSFYYVPTDKVVSHDYLHYLPIMQQHFSDFDLAGIITWHEGQNAPDRILTVHTTGDVDSANFGPASPEYMRNLLLALERNRINAGLDDFSVTTEATHWSGMVYGGGTPDMITQFPVPLLDIEIGSAPLSWSNETAAGVLAESLTSVFKSDGLTIKNLLCAGGVHFEAGFASAVFQTWDNSAFGISHILANQWLVTGGYDQEDGKSKLEACVDSIQGGIEGISFHDNLKGIYK
ncbi:MAG TPA: D-aminoacyl-tRNA deacylase, partial [Synergistales bacterium]|nr:D-aminoacyl-tRNA deacylase [Synergistales bacterium]